MPWGRQKCLPQRGAQGGLGDLRMATARRRGRSREVAAAGRRAGVTGGKRENGSRNRYGKQPAGKGDREEQGGALCPSPRRQLCRCPSEVCLKTHKGKLGFS